MFEGIYLWDAKYGIPTDPNNPESVEDFINELQEKPQEANANLYGFAQFFSEFLQQAEEHYPDDRAVTENQDIAYFDKEEPIDTILFLDEMPSDSFDYFASMLTHGANLYNLVYTDSMSYLIREPTDPAKTESDLTEWQQQLANLQQEPDTEQEALPTTKTKASKLVVKLLKERMAELNIEHFKVKAHDGVEATAKFNEYSIDYLHLVNVNRDDDDKIKVLIKPYMYIWIEGAQDSIDLDLIYFNKVPFDPRTNIKDRLVSRNISELKANIEKGLEMLMYIYPHIQSLDSLYQFFLKAKDDKHLSRAYFGNLAHIDQRTIYCLAIKTNQLNLPELHDKLKAEYIDDKLFALRENEKHWEAEEDRLEKENPHYKRYPFLKPEDPEAEYAQEFDDYVAQLGQG